MIFSMARQISRTELILLFIIFIPLLHAFPAAAGDTIPYFKPKGKLSYRLDLLSQSSFRSKSSREKARMLGVPDSNTSIPGKIQQTEDGDIIVELYMSEIDSAVLETLTSAGADILHVSKRYATITAAIAPENLKAVAAIPSVKSLTEVLTPIKNQVGCPGATTSGGDAQLKADSARVSFNIDGSGVKVGVLSDSYDKAQTPPTTAAQDVNTGDLPGATNPCSQTTPVTVLEDYSGSDSVDDEGRAMLQIVHDLAPGAQLGFATAWLGATSFADNIRDLRNTFGANIIVDDISYLNEPFFQDGPIAVAAQDVVDDGAMYFSSAGNFNVEVTVDGTSQPVGSYEASSFRTTNCPTSISSLGTYNGCHDFDPGAGTDNTSRFTLSTSGYIELIFQWNQPWYGVTGDFDIFMLNDSGNILAQSTNTETTSPYEELYYQNTTGSYFNVHFVIARGNGTTVSPRFKYIIAGKSGISNVEWSKANNTTDIFGPTIFGHTASSSVMSVAAMSFQDSAEVEDYSSRGYATMYYNKVSGTTPATALASGDTRLKPNFTATDGAKNTFFGSSSAGSYYFYGTSAAAPHAAAVAALIYQYGTNTGTMVRQSRMEQLLEDTATTIDGNPKSSGSGLIDALAALQSFSTNALVPSLLPAVITILDD